MDFSLFLFMYLDSWPCMMVRWTSLLRFSIYSLVILCGEKCCTQISQCTRQRVQAKRFKITGRLAPVNATIIYFQYIKINVGDSPPIVRNFSNFHAILPAFYEVSHMNFHFVAVDMDAFCTAFRTVLKAIISSSVALLFLNLIHHRQENQ